MTLATLDKKTVLVCDDNDDIREFISVLLSNAGYDVKLARDSREFLLQFKNCRPHVIVLDVRMPEHELRARWRGGASHRGGRARVAALQGPGGRQWQAGRCDAWRRRCSGLRLTVDPIRRH